MRIDTSNLGYKFFSHAHRKGHAAQWLGCVEASDGEQGALAFNPITGAYLMFRHGSRPLELDPMQVLPALADPVRLHPPGRKAIDVPAGQRLAMRAINISDQVHEAAKIMGEGNMSRGVRLAVEFAALREDDFNAWRATCGK